MINLHGFNAASAILLDIDELVHVFFCIYSPKTDTILQLRIELLES